VFESVTTFPPATMPTKPPSADWKGFAGLQPGPSSLREDIETIFSMIDLQQLEQAALRARISQDKAANPRATCFVNTSSFANGMVNLVLEVSFSDGVYWVARSRHRQLHAKSVAILLSEIATMKTVKERTSIPVPQVFAYELSSSNPVGYPYILMECLEGRELGGSIGSTVPPEFLPKVAKQIAEILVQLHRLTFDRLGRLWCGADGKGPLQIVALDSDKPSSPNSSVRTSLEWFYANRQKDNMKALRDHPDDPEWRTASWVLKAAAPHFIIEDRVHGPFPLCHIDFHHGNLLFDDDYNIKGVIDWSHAQTVPMERLAVSYEFIAGPAYPEKTKMGIARLRSLISEHLQHLERTELPAGEIQSTLLSDIFGSKRADIIHRCTSGFPRRALWEGRLVASMIYGEHVSWEQLVRVYGDADMF
jgi:isoamyl acetate esterase